MLKYAILLLLAGMVFAPPPSTTDSSETVDGDGGEGEDSDSGSQEAEGGINVADFRKIIEEIRGKIEETAQLFGEVHSQAQGAQSEADWEAVGQGLYDLGQEVPRKFGHAIGKLFHVAERLWENPGDFEERERCDAVDNLADSLDQYDNNEALGVAFAGAITEDLGCFRNEFQDAADFQVDNIAPPYSEEDAVTLINRIFLRAHLIKLTGERFGDAIEKVHARFTGGGNSEKREIKKLMELLKRGGYIKK